MSDPVLYHGTRRGFRPGGILLPPDTTGHQPSTHGYTVPDGWVDDREQYVYVTTDIDIARDFAAQAPGRGRPKVLIVTPMTPVEKDPATIGGHVAPTYRCGWARVDRIIPV